MDVATLRRRSRIYREFRRKPSNLRLGTNRTTAQSSRSLSTNTDGNFMRQISEASIQRSWLLTLRALRYLLLLTVLLCGSRVALADTNIHLGPVRISNAYVHNCCGRPPYVAITLSQPVADSTGCSLDKRTIAVPITDPLAQSLYATALAAMNANSLVDVWYSDSCSATTAFNTWVGIPQHSP